MKKLFSAITTMFLTVFIAFSETPLEALIHQAETAKNPFKTVHFPYAEAAQNKLANDYAETYSLYQITNEQLQQLIAENPRNIKLPVSLNGKEYVLKMTRMNILANDFKITVSDSDVPYTDNSKSVYYRGIVEGVSGSLATLSVFENDVMGVFSTPEEGNFVLGKIGDFSSNEYVLYNDQELKIKNDFRCKANDEDFVPRHNVNSSSSRENQDTRTCRAITMYYEANYKLYQSKQSSVTNVSNFIKGMFNSISTIYFNEYVNVKLDQIYVWTTPDSYSTTDAGDALDRFRSLRGSSMRGRLGQLLSSGAVGLGGLAWLDVLCSNSRALSFVGIGNAFSNFPTYSWNIEAMSHETGHNIASPHTHNCWAWTGGPIDGCGPAASSEYKEGNCTNGPLPNKGTVMSYCHLVQSVGINLSLGFGEQPGNLIRAAFTNASCVTEQEPFESVLSADTTYACEGDFIYMEVNPFDDVYFFYQWYRNGIIISSITNSLQATSNGTYYCVTTDSNSCKATSDSLVLNFISPNAEIITSEQPLCNSNVAELAAAGDDLLYVWSTGDTSQRITISGESTYSLTVTDTLGCSATAFVEVNKNSCSTGISETILTDLQIYPNPANDVLVIETTATFVEKMKVLVYDVTGKRLNTEIERKNQKLQLAVGSLASGVYVLQITINDQSVNRRFVKF